LTPASLFKREKKRLLMYVANEHRYPRKGKAMN
jgi:hypothetical protein